MSAVDRLNPYSDGGRGAGDSGLAASRAGLKTGDVFASTNGKPVVNGGALQVAVSQMGRQPSGKGGETAGDVIVEVDCRALLRRATSWDK